MFFTMVDTLYIVLYSSTVYICTSNFVMLSTYSAFVAACFCKIQFISVQFSVVVNCVLPGRSGYSLSCCC